LIKAECHPAYPAIQQLSVKQLHVEVLDNTWEGLVPWTVNHQRIWRMRLASASTSDCFFLLHLTREALRLPSTDGNKKVHWSLCCPTLLSDRCGVSTHVRKCRDVVLTVQATAQAQVEWCGQTPSTWRPDFLLDKNDKQVLEMEGNLSI
jgi:hypothetical protein